MLLIHNHILSSLIPPHLQTSFSEYFIIFLFLSPPPNYEQRQCSISVVIRVEGGLYERWDWGGVEEMRGDHEWVSFSRTRLQTDLHQSARWSTAGPRCPAAAQRFQIYRARSHTHDIQTYTLIHGMSRPYLQADAHKHTLTLRLVLDEPVDFSSVSGQRFLAVCV